MSKLNFVKIPKGKKVKVNEGSYSCCNCHEKQRVKSGTSAEIGTCPRCGYDKYLKIGGRD